METTRRGFMGLLAGAILGKIIGPKLIASPTHENWLHAVSLERPTPVESFRPLEVISARVLEVIERELKWLRMKHVNAEPWQATRIGDTAFYRNRDPQPFVLYQPWPMIERLTPVTMMQQVGVDLRLDDLNLLSHLGEFSDRYIEPLGISMAEQIIRSVRRGGGADVLVTANPDINIPFGPDRAIISRLPDNALSLRAVEYRERHRERGYPAARILRFDMVYGLGVVES